MEEKEPVDLQRAEQTDLVSLIISGEEEAAQEEGDLGHCSGGEEDGIANGHIEDESESSMVTPIGSPGTSYWSITEGPDQPLLLSPIPGPSGCKPRVQRASRQGLSRIPGRDHRRYYHEYWRSEYLMDFDPLRHGMICMVCGSSLATLKLSTIKRHIRQKHPDSLLWSAADKEVIRSGWESHLSLEGSQRSYCSAAGPSPSPPRGKDEPPDATEYSSATVDPVNSVATCFITHEPSSADLGPEDPMPPQQQQQQQQPQQQQNPEPPSPPPPEPHPAAVEPPGEPKREDPAGPSTQTLKRYLNDSLHAWFRQEFLMEYEAEAGRLLCMVCGGQPPSLHLDHIKSHVLDGHPDSLVYSAEEKHCILQAWAQTHAEGAEGFVKSEPDTKDAELGLFPQDAGCGLLTQDACLIGEDGGLGPPEPAPPVRQPRRRRLRGGDPWRLRLDYLVAYGPQGRGTYCMVCSQALPETKVSGFRRHIQECHPETTSLSREEREAMAAAWTKDYHSEDTHVKEEAAASEPTTPQAAAAASPGAASPSKPAKRKREDEEEGGKAREGAAPSSSRHSHYPGKDQRRNYQVRWRMEYLMDYDCLRHGLICMVCGATLATLKVSTIKRHIQQVHPRSLAYSPAEKRQALLGYSQTALHFVHSDDCFSAQDHGHGVPLPPLQGLELDPDLEPDPDLDPHPEPDPDRDLEPDLDPAPDRDLEPDTEPAPDPEPDLEPEPEQE